MKIGISADSACDLSAEQIARYNINIMPMIITMDDGEYEDGINVTQDMLFDYAKRTNKLPKTAARNEFEYKEHFENMLKTFDHIIHFAISSKISSTINNAQRAAESLGADKVTIVDAYSISTGIGLQILDCAEKIEAGMALADLKQSVFELPSKVQASFLVDTLRYLHMGGRCSALSAFVAGILPIKPRISLVDGAMKATKKYMGKIEISLLKYIDDIVKECPPDLKRVIITYSTPTNNMAQIRQKLENLGFDEILESQAGPTVSTHCGPKTLGIMYIKA